MIVLIELFNAGPFRGHHCIDLGAGAYGITARHETDRKRSNAIGKSFLLEMVDFALTGRLRKERQFDVDGWITRGEKEAHVRITLECGATIKRSKKRGQSRQTRVQLPGREEAAQDAAHDSFLRYLGFTENDFRHASYFEQREMARLVHADPGSRLEIVTGWLGLGLGEKAEAHANDLALEMMKETDRLVARKQALMDVDAPTSEEKPFDRYEVDKAITEAEAKIEKVREQINIIQEREWAARTIEAQDKRIADGKLLRMTVDAGDAIEKRAEEAQHEIDVAIANRSTAKQERDQRQKVSLGLFDGQCPVAPITCPVKKKINEDRDASTKALKKARQALETREQELTNAREHAKEDLENYQDLLEQRRDLERMRKETKANAEQTKNAYAVLEKPDIKIKGIDDEDRVDHLANIEQETNELLFQLKNSIAVHDQLERRRERNAAELTRITTEAEVASKKHMRAMRAKNVYRAAQRRVAERALIAIEHNANAAIAEAGIDLTVKARWEREGKGAAKACEECGSAFPTSLKAKTCERCGAQRGMHAVQRLDFMLSDSSGAYDDLAGISWQFAAGEWLLRHRESPWSTALLDEPFAHADPVVRRGLARYLLQAVRGSVYRQLLVISHTADTIDVLPHRIEVVQKQNGDRYIEQS